MQIKTGYKELVRRAEQEVNALSPQEVAARKNLDGVLLIDIRDIREVKRDGKIPGSKHIPRGMLEFWIDPSSEYYKPYFDSANEIIFYCNKGWRSALATKTVQDMGAENVAHMTGGYEDWVSSGGETEE